MLIQTLVLFSLLSAPERIHSYRIEGKVGKDIITSIDIDQRADLLKREGLRLDASSLRKKAFDSLIDETLISQYLDTQGMGVTEKEIDQRMASIRASHGATSNEEFKNILEKQGITLTFLREQVRRQIEQGQFYQAMRRQATKVIGDKDLLSFYQSNKGLFEKNYELELAECVIPADVPNLKELAEKYKEKPSQFGECIKKHSRSPSAQEGGKIGTFRRGDLRDDIEAALFAANSGEVVSIQQPGAIQLLKIVSKKNIGAKSFESAKDEIKGRLEQELTQQEWKKTLSDLRSNTYIKI